MWLVNDLAKIDRTVTPWVIGLWHRQWYGSVLKPDDIGENMRVILEPLFDKYKVDLGIYGHVHAYERISNIYDYVIDPSKTAYLLVGNGGTPNGLHKEWQDPAPEWSEYRLSAWGYGSLNLINVTHAHWTMFADNNGTIYDETWFIRPYPR